MQQHPEQADLPAYELGALDAEEVVHISAHLAHCPSCRGEVATYQAIVGMLLYAVPPQDPPAHLRCQILARIAACTASQAMATAEIQEGSP